ncbi:MAG TPA: DoxX family protein [Opitutaceae bacterium]|nr:DoxX family protein [Opitutaceae bacterium]
MKTPALIAQVLLGLLFLVVGLNGFLHFISTPQLPVVAGQFVGAMGMSHYLAIVWVVQIVGGTLLLINRFVAAALALLAPVLGNIALFHVFMAPVAYAPAVIAFTLWTIVFVRERAAFQPLLAAKALPAPSHATE